MLPALLLLSLCPEYLFETLQDTLDDYKMIIAFGQPVQQSTYTSRKLTFDECVQLCWQDFSCVQFVYEGTTLCQMYKMAQISTVQKTTSGKRVAFRVKSTTCPATSPLLNGAVMQGDTGEMVISKSSYKTFVTYSITMSSNLWTFTISSTLTCPLAFTFTRRTKGIWCIGVFSARQCINQTIASQNCAAYTPDGRLSGFETEAEFSYIMENALGYVPSTIDDTSYSQLGFWVDGIRKSHCKYPTAKSSKCNGTNEFTFSDTMMSTPGGYVWLSGQPSGISENSSNANCLFFNAKINATQGIDDSSCSSFKTSSMCYAGYVCGLKPTTS